MVKVLIKKLDRTVNMPIYKTSGASGMDVMAFIKNPIKLEPQKSCLVPSYVQLDWLSCAAAQKKSNKPRGLRRIRDHCWKALEKAHLNGGGGRFFTIIFW